MHPVEFDGVNRVYAKDQPEYLPLPVLAKDGPEGDVVSCWKLSWRERWIAFWRGRLWLSMWTFGRPLQPVRPSVDRRELIQDVQEGGQ